MSLNTRKQKAFPIARHMPLEVGILHFVGIGGIGMSGIAEILHNLGYQVQGSDLSESGNVERLRGLGIRVHIGHNAQHLEQASVVVISSAVKADNPEVVEARSLRIPIVRRAEMLAELMRLKLCVAVAGTHGKTTTTSLTAALLDGAGFEPTVINGGIINAYGTNARIGSGDWMVVEADESDGTFIKVPAAVAIITNIDPEHLEYYGSFDALRAAFQQFIENLPFYGFGVLCIDHPEVLALAERIRDRRIISYGVSPDAEIRALNHRRDATGQIFDIAFDGHAVAKDVFLPMHGEHNMRNALAAAAVAYELKITPEQIKTAFARFGGVKRRFTRTGEAGGITIIDDYAHHPVEIRATLKAARESLSGVGGKVIAVAQPHRYTRLRDLFADFATCFTHADHVLVTEVYSAGETPIDGVNSAELVRRIIAADHGDAALVDAPEGLAEAVLAKARPGDLVVCLGAGSISKWAYALPGELARLQALQQKEAS